MVRFYSSRFLILLMLGILPGATALAATVQIRECSVANGNNNAQNGDCTAVAARLCDGQSQCELPIGLNLTGGKPLGPLAAEVRVKYLCGKTMFDAGPYVQNDHASITLACAGL